jgi:hypothetical protein
VKEPWGLPPEADAACVAVREVCHRPCDPKRPMVGRDAASKQLIAAVAEPVPASPGQPERIDSEAVRNGTATLVLIGAPLVGGRQVEGTERRTAKDFAAVVRWLVAEVPPDAAKAVLVLDNLNTPKLASLDEAFPPERARRIAERREVHHPPKPGSYKLRGK